MYRMLNRLWPLSLKEKIGRLRKQVTNFQILARDYAQWPTVRDWECRDAKGHEIPWYTYPAIEYFSHIDFCDMNVFEFGSGNSTIWWASQAKSIVSIEDDQSWYERVNRVLQKNKHETVKYELIKDKSSYVESLRHDFDIVIVDGKHRPECVDRYLSLERSGVMLVFDNSDWYPQSLEKIRCELKWIEIDFHGFGPINNYTWCTTVFVNPECSNRISYKKALEPISGLKQNAED